MKTIQPKAKWYFSVLIVICLNEKHLTITRWCIYYKKPSSILAKTRIFFDLVIYKRIWLILLYIVIFIIVTITIFLIVIVIVTITITIIYTISINNKISPCLLMDIEANIRLYLFYLIVAKVENNSFQHPYTNTVHANIYYYQNQVHIEA